VECARVFHLLSPDRLPSSAIFQNFPKQSQNLQNDQQWRILSSAWNSPGISISWTSIWHIIWPSPSGWKLESFVPTFGTARQRPGSARDAKLQHINQLRHILGATFGKRVTAPLFQHFNMFEVV
jgi:hypothetical protein